MKNYAHIEFAARSANEGFARTAVAAFAAQLDPTVEEIADIKTAVSEAVTNAIIHGYEGRDGVVKLSMYIEGRTITVVVEDQGRGIADINKAMRPLYTSKPHLERSGMGFTVMESFMDTLEVKSQVDAGTTVRMTKKIL